MLTDDEKQQLRKRARPGQRKRIVYKVYPGKDAGLPDSGEVELRAGYCPCTVCGHKLMAECEAAAAESGEACECCYSSCY